MAQLTNCLSCSVWLTRCDFFDCSHTSEINKMKNSSLCFFHLSLCCSHLSFCVCVCKSIIHSGKRIGLFCLDGRWRLPPNELYGRWAGGFTALLFSVCFMKTSTILQKTKKKDLKTYFLLSHMSNTSIRGSGPNMKALQNYEMTGLLILWVLEHDEPSNWLKKTFWKQVFIQFGLFQVISPILFIFTSRFIN